jgi:hypothetical protein
LILSFHYAYFVECVYDEINKVTRVELPSSI